MHFGLSHFATGLYYTLSAKTKCNILKIMYHHAALSIGIMGYEYRAQIVEDFSI